MTLGPPGDALEQEADAAARSVAAGGAAKVRTGSVPAGVRSVQRAEYGTYISKLTEAELKPFLDNAEVYYKNWSYPNVKRVSTMEEVLDDLGKAKGHIDTFRIVAHAASFHLQLGLTSAISREEVTKTQMGLTTPEKFRPLFTGNKVVNDASYTKELKILRADATTSPLLKQIGVGQTDPGNDEPLGILLRAIFDSDLVSSAKLDDGSQAVFKNRAALDDFSSRRIRHYRAVVEAAAPLGQTAVVKKPSPISSPPRRPRCAAATWTGPSPRTRPTVSARTSLMIRTRRPQPKPGAGCRHHRRRGQGELLAEAEPGPHPHRQEHPYRDPRLQRRGRHVVPGEYPSVFAPSSTEQPSISAPDLFQAFFKLGFESYDQAVPADQKRLQDTWDDKTTGLADAYDNAYRTRNGEMIRVVSDTTLSALIARYKLSRTEQELKDLNPELKPDNLQPGQVVWLVGRQLPAGANTTLEDFCQNVLGDKHLWPTIWGYNSQWTKPPLLKPNDMVWVVPPAQRKRMASAPRSLADFQADLQRATAFGMATPSNQFKLHIDHPQRAASVGAWVEKQGYDYKGRSAAKLSKMFGGDFKKSFMPTISGHAGQFLTRGFPNAEDPILPDDPRYAGHIIRVS